MDPEPPRMFRAPSDPLEPLPPLRANEPVVRLRTEWARLHDKSVPTSVRRRLRARIRAVRLRLIVALNARYAEDVVRAVDAIALRCDELSERITHLSSITDDLARAVSQEVTDLRTVVEQLRRHDQSSPQSQDQ
jgi:hypothetical protein